MTAAISVVSRMAQNRAAMAEKFFDRSAWVREIQEFLVLCDHVLAYMK